MTTIAQVICAGCGKSDPAQRKSNRLPSRWKRIGEQTYCSVCIRQRLVLRAIIIRVAAIKDGTWEDFNDAMYKMWTQTTACSNWMMSQLYLRDVRRENGQTKLPAMPKIYLYPEARGLYPDLPSTSVAALEQSVKRNYTAKRFDLIWRHAASLPTFRYPTPFSLPNQAWSVEMEDNLPVVSARIGDRRWKLQLRGTQAFRRQIKAVRQLISDGIQGSLDLYQVRIDGRSRVMCKMVAWLPRSEAPQRQGILAVRSTKESLLVATNAKDDKVWTYNADQLRRWIAEYSHQLNRWADDTKSEDRPVPAFASRRRAAAEKYHKRTTSAIQQIAASLVGYAQRRQVAQMRYDDSETGFCPSFPWFSLRRRISVKCHELGIGFEAASATVEEVPPEALAQREGDSNQYLGSRRA